ncbi:hypothetical protein [Onishia taeanensis]
MPRKTLEEREISRLKCEITGVTLSRLLCVGFAMRHAVLGEWHETLLLLGLAYLLRLFLPVTR